MARLRILAMVPLVASGFLPGCVLESPGEVAQVEQTELEIQLTRCEVDRNACPESWSVAADGEAAFRRISEEGYDYGDCYGMILAVLLFPEPCAETWEAEAPLTEEAGAPDRAPF